jgi:type II secretory pathway pseudopilin PulG
MRRQNGFTLIEALVVGIIGSILAGMFIAFMYVHNDAVNSGVARGILLTQSEIVSNRIAAAVRGSNGVFTKGDAWSPTPQLTPKATDTLICLRRPGDTIAIFRIGLLHRLREGTSMGNLPYFKTGRDTVSLVAGSSFWLSADRKRVTLNLTFTKVYRGKTYTLPSKRDSYLCRN